MLQVDYKAVHVCIVTVIINSNQHITKCCHLLIVVVTVASHVRLFETPWTAAQQASLSFTISWSLLEFICIELLMLSVSPSTTLFSLVGQMVKNLHTVQGSFPGSGRSSGEGNDYPLQYSCLNSTDRRVCWATVHGVTQNHDSVTFFFTLINGH